MDLVDPQQDQLDWQNHTDAMRCYSCALVSLGLVKWAPDIETDRRIRLRQRIGLAMMLTRRGPRETWRLVKL